MPLSLPQFLLYCMYSFALISINQNKAGYNLFPSDKLYNYMLIDTNSYYFSEDDFAEEVAIYDLGNKYNEEITLELIENINIMYYNFSKGDLTYKSKKCGGYGASNYMKCAMDSKFPNRTFFDRRTENWEMMFIDKGSGELVTNIVYFAESDNLSGDYYLKKVYTIVKVYKK